MAAAVIPIALAGADALFPLIEKYARPLIQFVEAHLPKGSKLIPVIQGVQALLGPSATSGDLKQPVPTVDELKPVIEGILASMKAQNELPAPGSGAAGLAALAAKSAAPPLPVPISGVLQGISLAKALLTTIESQAGVTL